MRWEFFLAGALAAEAAALVLWHACSCRTSQLLGPVVLRADKPGPRVALTFDDGPTPPFTAQVLNVLRAAGVRATFFVCGKNAERHPDLLARIVEEQHAVANHSYSHPYFYLLSPSRMAREIDATEAILHQVTGQGSKFFRPPYGARWPGLYGVLRKRGMPVVHWSHAGEDWRNPSANIAVRATAGLQAGSIIVLHDGLAPESRHLRTMRRIYGGGDRGSGGGPAETVKALPLLIERVRARGLDFARLDEMIAPAGKHQPD